MAKKVSKKFIVRWEDPPKSRRGRKSTYEEAINELKANPGYWGVIKKFPTQEQASRTSSHLKNSPAYDTSKMEFTVRGSTLYGIAHKRAKRK